MIDLKALKEGILLLALKALVVESKNTATCLGILIYRISSIGNRDVSNMPAVHASIYATMAEFPQILASQSTVVVSAHRGPVPTSNVMKYFHEQ